LASKQPVHTSARDLSVLVNNALLAWKKNLYFLDLEEKKGPAYVEKRMAKLRAYMEAHLAPLVEHINEGLLDPSEAVYISLAETTMLVGTRLKGVSKFPAFQDLGKSLVEDATVVEDLDGE
jgi:hypothetical protein